MKNNQKQKNKRKITKEEQQNENLRDKFLKKPNEIMPSLKQPSIVKKNFFLNFFRQIV